MFTKDKDKNAGGSAAQNDAENGSNMEAPPLKPFSKKGTHAPSKPAGGSFRPEIPRRVAEIPGGPRDRRLGLDDDANRLTVGRNICLNGEITACEKLVVEGRVEASLTDAHVIEVAPTGYFKGNADVEEADISGVFEGTLLAKDKLNIRKDGKVIGSVRYGKIVIEAGGEISGDMASLAQAEDGGSSDGDS